MTDSSPDSLSRRRIVKSLGLGAGVALAGCSGGGDGGSGGESLGTSGDGGDSLQSTSTDGKSGGGGADSLHWDAGLPSDEEDLETALSNIQNYFNERTGKQLKITDFTYEDMRSSYLTGARSGEPDSAEGVLSHFTEYAKAGLIEPIGDQAKELDWFDGYVDSTIEAMKYEGELYALPYTGNGRALIYRRDVFDELGQDPPETAQEFLEIGRMIESETDLTAFHNCTKEGGVRAFQEWMSHVYQHTDNLYVKEGDGWKLNVDAETLGLVFDKFYYQVWASDNPIANTDQLGTGWQTNDPGYINGNLAMIECGPWIRGWTSGPEIDNSDKATTVLDENTAVAHLPYAEGGQRGTYLEVKPVMVNSHSKNTDLGFEAVASRCSPTVMNKQKSHSPGNYVTPVHEDVESTLKNENWMPFTDVFETGRALAKISWGPVRQEFYPVMQQVAYGKTDPYKAGKNLHSSLKDLESEL